MSPGSPPRSRNLLHAAGDVHRLLDEELSTKVFAVYSGSHKTDYLYWIDEDNAILASSLSPTVTVYGDKTVVVASACVGCDTEKKRIKLDSPTHDGICANSEMFSLLKEKLQ